MLVLGPFVESFPIPFPIASAGNGNGRNEIILPELCAAIASRVILSWHENCRPAFFNNLRGGEIGQGLRNDGNGFWCALFQGTWPIVLCFP